MSGENTRPALGDLSNLPLKRGFSSVYSDSGLKSVEGAEDSGFAKQVCLGVENLVRERCQSGFKSGDGTGKGILVKKDGKVQSSDPAACKIDIQGVGNVVSLVSDGPKDETQVKEASNPLDGGTIVIDKIIRDASGDSCGSSRTDSDDELKTTYNVSLSQQSIGEVFGSSQGLTDESKDPVVDGFNAETTGLAEGRSKTFQLDRCTRLEDGDGCANRNLSADFLKTCSCSLCLTAAFMWSDLHYQDVKGRLSALKKSQKEASILVNKFSRGRQAEIHHDQGTSSKPLQLETDLTCQWRSLFQHMENIFAQESTQIEKNLFALKDLRESCKTDLEKTTRAPPEN
ncbi:hypothetical protein LINGRAPRIM_LOCUS913 [Linum grandiflorum]